MIEESTQKTRAKIAQFGALYEDKTDLYYDISRNQVDKICSMLKIVSQKKTSKKIGQPNLVRDRVPSFSRLKNQEIWIPI